MDFVRPPIEPSAGVLRAVRSCDPSSAATSQEVALRLALATLWKCDAACVTVANGFNELLYLLARSIGAGALSFTAGPPQPDIERACLAAGLINAVHLVGPLLAWDVQAALARIVQLRPALVWVGAPNSVSGRPMETCDVDALIEATGSGLVVIDASLACFAESPPDLLRWQRRSNVVILQSLGPAYGIEGLRVACAVAPRQVAGMIASQQPRNHLNAAGQSAALAALSDPSYLRRWATVRRRRTEMATRLGRAGFACIASDADFLWVGVRKGVAARQALARAGIQVISGDDYGLPRHIRVAVRPRADIQALVDALLAL